MLLPALLPMAVDSCRLKSQTCKLDLGNSDNVEVYVDTLACMVWFAGLVSSLNGSHRLVLMFLTTA